MSVYSPYSFLTHLDDDCEEPFEYVWETGRVRLQTDKFLLTARGLNPLLPEIIGW